MSITTYAELQTAIAAWLARDDLTATIPDFIALFEADANLKLRTRLQTATASFTTTNGEHALPADFSSAVRVTFMGSARAGLQYLDPEVLLYDYPTGPTGMPAAYTVEGTTLRVRPIDDGTPLELVYRALVPPLAAGVNWLLQKYPNLYLFGSLCEAQGFAVDADKFALWQARRDQLYRDIQLDDFRSIDGATIRPLGATP